MSDVVTAEDLRRAAVLTCRHRVANIPELRAMFRWYTGTTDDEKAAQHVRAPDLLEHIQGLTSTEAEAWLVAQRRREAWCR